MENNKKPERRVRKFFIKGVKALLEKLEREEKIIIDKEGIMSILPHRGDKLLLDKVTITTKKIIGEFKVTNEVCEGHAVLDGKLVMKGSDVLDMAAQLLGVWLAQHTGHIEASNKRVMVREYGGAKFRKPIYPDEVLTLEVDAESVSAEVFSEDKLIIAKGSNFLAKAGEERKADIYSVELVFVKA